MDGRRGRRRAVRWRISVPCWATWSSRSTAGRWPVWAGEALEPPWALAPRSLGSTADIEVIRDGRPVTVTASLQPLPVSRFGGAPLALVAFATRGDPPGADDDRPAAALDGAAPDRGRGGLRHRGHRRVGGRPAADGPGRPQPVPVRVRVRGRVQPDLLGRAAAPAADLSGPGPLARPAAAVDRARLRPAARGPGGRRHRGRAGRRQHAELAGASGPTDRRARVGDDRGRPRRDRRGLPTDSRPATLPGPAAGRDDVRGRRARSSCSRACRSRSAGPRWHRAVPSPCSPSP